MSEKTTYQLYRAGIDDFDGSLDFLAEAHITKGKAWFVKVREMRKDPTIALVRKLVAALVLSPGWRIETNPDAPKGVKDYVKMHFFPHRFSLLRNCVAGLYDFGWQGFEKVLKQSSDGTLVPHKFKPLLQDITKIRCIKKTGQFNGFIQEEQDGNPEVKLDLKDALLFNVDVEGTYWYGDPIMRNVEQAYDDALVVNDAANRFDRKLAGSHWVIHYPIGHTKVNGEKMDNYDLAMMMLGRLQSAGGIVLPNDVRGYINDLNASQQDATAWKVEIIDSKGSTRSAFTERSNYLDKLKVRGLGFLERAILEGQFGTKAEAGEHGDLSISNVELMHQEICQFLNWHCLNHLLIFNFGEEAENSARIMPNPILDAERQRFIDIYDKIITNPQALLEELPFIDMDALREKVDIPTEENPEEPPVELPNINAGLHKLLFPHLKLAS